MSKTALIVVDLQNDYLSTGKWPLVGIDAVVEKAVKIIEDSRAKGHKIFNVRHEFAFANPPFFEAGTPGSEYIPAIAPKEGDVAILKNFPNSFQKTTLKEQLDAAGIEETIIIGAMSHVCIDATVRAAADFGFKVTVVDDACATLDVEHRGVKAPAAHVHAAVMAALGFAYGKVVTFDEYLPQ